MLLILILTTLFLGCSNKETTRIPQESFELPNEVPPELPPEAPGFLAFDRFEQEIIDDLQSLPEQKRLRTRYIWNNRFNEGVADAELRSIKDGVNFGINSLSVERDIETLTPVGSSNQIYRVDLADFGLSKIKWEAIAERLDIPVFSLTIRGATIRALSQTATPWSYSGDFFFTSNNSPGLYYFLVEQPGIKSLAGFFAGIGTDPQREFDDLEGVCAGYTESQIALQKNRMVCVLDSADGSVWTTYDTDSKANAGDNLNETPFVIEARSKKTMVHDAQEHLYTGGNGLLFKRLNAAAVNGAAGAAADLAPIDVVINRNAAVKGLSPEIDLVSCSLCHFAGIIPVTDQIGPHIQRTPGFDADDKLRGENIFRQDRVSVLLRQDNDRLKTALGRMGISQFEKDPLNNSITDPHRLEQNIKQIAALFFLPPDEFAKRLQASPTASIQVGNLLNGGAIGLDLLKASFNTIIQDLNLFKDRDQVN